MKRNREQRARIKMIQEMHLKKGARAWLDAAVNFTSFTYSQIYKRWREISSKGEIPTKERKCSHDEQVKN